MISAGRFPEEASNAAQGQMLALAWRPCSQPYPIGSPGHLWRNDNGSFGINESQGVRRLAVQGVITLKT